MFSTISKIKATASRTRRRRSRFSTGTRCHRRTQSDIEKILEEYESSERIETARYVEPIQLKPKLGVHSGRGTPNL